MALHCVMIGAAIKIRKLWSTYLPIPYYPVLEQVSSLETFLGSLYSRNTF